MNVNQDHNLLPGNAEHVPISEGHMTELQPGGLIALDPEHHPFFDAAHEAREHLEQGHVSQGWQALGDVGDPYAAVAAHGTGDSHSFSQALVQAAWEHGAGVTAYQDHFQDVAECNLDNYLDHIETHGGLVPNSREIEGSYAACLDQQGLPPDTAIALVLNDAPLGNAWEHYVGLDSDRISEQDLGAGLGQWEAVGHAGAVGWSAAGQWTGDHLLEAREDLQAVGQQAQDTAQHWGEQVGDQLLDARDAMHDWGTQAQQGFHEVGQTATGSLQEAQQSVSHVVDVVSSLHDDRNVFNECPAEQPVSIGLMNIDKDAHLENAAIDGSGKIWEQRDESLSGFHDGVVFNHTLENGQGQYECEYDPHGQYQPGGTFNYAPYDQWGTHGLYDVVPHIFDPQYAQTDHTTVVPVEHFQADNGSAVPSVWDTQADTVSQHDAFFTQSYPEYTSPDFADHSASSSNDAWHDNDAFAGMSLDIGTANYDSYESGSHDSGSHDDGGAID